MDKPLVNPTVEAERLSKVMTTLVFGQPFWAMLALRLVRVASMQYQGIAVDGRTMFYNPNYTATLSDSELLGAVAEVVAHCALGHPWRGAGFVEQGVWNQSCDYAVRPLLEGSNFTLPAYHRRPDLSDKSAEQIYRILILEPPQEQDQGQNGNNPGQGGAGQGQGQGQSNQGNGQGQGSGQNNGQGQGTGFVQVIAPQNDSGQLEAEWNLAVEQAYQYSKGRGDLPSGAEKLVEAIKRTTIDWRAELRRYLQHITRNDYAWSRPNPRYASMSLYLPDLRSEDAGELVIALDTSGSTANLVQDFVAEVAEILEEVKPKRVHLLQCDAAIHEATTYEYGESLELRKVKGGGGTNFAPVFKWVEDNLDNPPECLLYLTDLDGHLPDKAPSYPVLWASTEDEQEMPFGDVLYIYEEA